MIDFYFGDYAIELDLGQADAGLQRIENAVGSRKVTGQLLDAVAKWLSELGLPGCTRTAAWQFWWAVYERIDNLRKAHARDADIAFWFGVDPYSLSDEQRMGLLANMSRVQAQSILHQGNYSATDYENVYRLTLQATGDEAQARQARAAALEAYVDSRIAKKGRS